MVANKGDGTHVAFLHGIIARSSLLVAPVCSDAVLRDPVHLLGAYLDLHGHAIKAEHHSVQRLVAVVLLVADVVLEAALNWRPKPVHLCTASTTLQTVPTSNLTFAHQERSCLPERSDMLHSETKKATESLVDSHLAQDLIAVRLGVHNDAQRADIVNFVQPVALGTHLTVHAPQVLGPPAQVPPDAHLPSTATLVHK